MSEDKLTATETYPIGDALTAEERPRFRKVMAEDKRVQIQGHWDGHPRRCPKRGEWFLSGAPITAYRAPNDLSTPYHIANLVATKQVFRRAVLDDNGVKVWEHEM